MYKTGKKILKLMKNISIFEYPIKLVVTEFNKECFFTKETFLGEERFSEFPRAFYV